VKRFGFRTMTSVFLVVIAISGSLVAAPALASTRHAAPGVTEDEIVVVGLVADLDGLRERGLIQQPKLTTGNLIKRWQGFFDAYGRINGRKVVVKPVVWDPLDITTYARACTEMTQDIRPFVVLNSAGFRQSDIPCVTIDGKTPMINGDPVYQDLLDRSGNRLFSLMPPADVMGKGTADIIAKRGIVPKTAKIGILSSNDAGVKAAGDALEKQLKKNGYTVASKVELNQLSGDSAAANRESSAAVATFKAAGVDTVFDGVPFIYTNGYFQEVQRSNAGFKTFVLDDSPSMCTIFGASRIPAEAAGAPCLTASDTRAVPTKDGLKTDTEFEAKCRAIFDKTFNQKSQPGVPSGDLTVNGVTYTEDVDMSYCNIVNLLVPAMKRAGRNLTWNKVAKELEKTGTAPAGYLSNGEGSLGKGKHYFADNIHVVNLSGANKDTPEDAHGLFNGCPAPTSCFIPQLVDGKEWFPVTQASG
jgi:hypothetical protein